MRKMATGGFCISLSIFLVLVQSINLTTAATTVSSSAEIDLKNSLQKVFEKSTIGIGKGCLVSNERKRTEWFKSILNYTNTPIVVANNSQALDQLYTNLKLATDKFLLALNGSLCNSNNFELLRCVGNGTSGSCGCASSGDYGVGNMKVVRVGDTCRLAKTSLCGPNPIAPSNTTVKPADFKLFGSTCEAGSTCIVKGSKNTACTEIEFLKLIKGAAAPATSTKPATGATAHDAHGAAPATNTTTAVANVNSISLDLMFRKIMAGSCVCTSSAKSLVSFSVNFFMMAWSVFIFRFM